MPRTKKPAGTAVDPRNGRRAELEAVSVEPPAINRKKYLAVTLSIWDAYWGDLVASTQTPADLVVALTWIENVDDYWRKKRAADSEPTVEGSMGQIVANPLYTVANQALQAAERAAKQLGIGAKNRADLGISLLAGQEALDDLNRRYWEEEPDGDDLDDDPR